MVAPPPQGFVARQQPHGENTDLPRNVQGGEALARWLELADAHCLVAAPVQLANLLTWFPTSGPKKPCGCALQRRAAWLLPLGKSHTSGIGNVRVLDHYGLTETAYGGAVGTSHTRFHVENWTF